MPLKKGLNLGERPNLLFHLLKSVLFDMCLLSESVDQLNNVIVNKGKPISDDQFTLLYELDTLQIMYSTK